MYLVLKGIVEGFTGRRPHSIEEQSGIKSVEQLPSDMRRIPGLPIVDKDPGLPKNVILDIAEMRKKNEEFLSSGGLRRLGKRK